MSNQESEITYSYDEVGNRTQKTKDGVTVTYAYQNGCNRVTGWTATSTDDFASLRRVDVSGHSSETIGTNPALGQLFVSNVVATVVPTVSGTNFSTASFLLDFGTQQIAAAIGDVAGNVGYATNTVVMQIVTNATYGFNASGCVTSIVYHSGDVTETLALTWNGRYELTAVATNGVVAEENGYDPLGRRAWCSVRSQSGQMETNFFVYDQNWQVLADLDSTGGLVRSYVWGPGIDNLLAMTVHTGATAKTYFYLTDHQGTVHAVADETGSIVESYRFDAWGRVLGVYDGSGSPIGNQQSEIRNRYLWQGREYSWRTGFYYFRARWYDPITGRWCSNDPIGISGGLNQYMAFNANPVNFIDPFGFKVTFWGKVRTVVEIIDLIPIGAYPHPATWTIAFVLDVGAAVCGYTDIYYAEVCEEKKSLARKVWGIGTVVTIAGYVPDARAALLAIILEGLAFEYNIYNLTDQWNPLYDW